MWEVRDCSSVESMGSSSRVENMGSCSRVESMGTCQGDGNHVEGWGLQLGGKHGELHRGGKHEDLSARWKPYGS